MYLKTLALRGFKSFADKVTLKLEPGITAVVGPNGSGKSNISDAVLWVLGERNAKNLRGQAMEDVIFSGSSARKAASMAEVELVLDNSDGTLPIDFQEVSVARRMYRSGESEYLINGALARRMDVLEILHDSGLGSGTHSIISQGSLDSVLQSKPEDRRALIEEAAGVLKHKQRMAKSARKLERMEAHVNRVSDVANEVARQLGPLERKAKRALRYAELAEELASVKLVLAVDDLRTLRTAHARISERERASLEDCEARKAASDALDAQMSELQQRIREDSQDASILSQSYQQAATAAERLDSTSMLIRDRRRSALARATELEMHLQQSSASIQRAQAKLTEARRQADADESASKESAQKVEALTKADADATNALAATEERHAALMQKGAQADASIARLREDLAQAKEMLTNSMAQIKVIEGHKAELSVQIDRLSADAKVSQAEAVSAEEALASLDEQEKAARTLVGTCMQAREEARRAADDAQAQERSLEAQVKALEEIEQAESDAAEAGAQSTIAALRAHGDEVSVLSREVKAPPHLEALVEALLGADLAALMVLGADEVRVAGRAVDGDDTASATLIMAHDPSRARAQRTAPSDAGAFASRGVRLIDNLEYPKDRADAIYAILGDVILCSSLDEALAEHEKDATGRRFATQAGDVVYPSGKVELRCRVSGANAGVLSRLRRIEELRASLVSAQASSVRAAEEATSAEDALMRAQTESLTLKEKLATLKGSAQSARQAADDAVQKLASVTRELEGLEAVLTKESTTADAARPNIKALELELQEAQSASAQIKQEAEEVARALDPLRLEQREAHAQLAEAQLEAAKLAERSTYSARVISGALSELEGLQASREEDQRVLKAKRMSATRLEPVLSIMDIIVGAARRALRNLEEQTSCAKSSTEGLHEQLQALREQARAEQDGYDRAQEALASIRVEKARAEMSVQAAVNVITEDCGRSLEEALTIPSPEDRALAEEESFRLTKRIANLGTINPDAAQEYEQLKSRYDYLESQLSDLRSAARSLKRIDGVIEERMKDDFARTFRIVDENFQEIFSTLFPGGNAHLSLVDPEDVEQSGVEVHAQPAGKRISKMSLMSGGEKSLTALALLFALYKTRATPFYILDEVEAALDDSNLRRLITYIQQMRADTQLIMITHQRRTMEMADVLFGVSMQADGVTKVLSQKLEDALRTKAS